MSLAYFLKNLFKGTAAGFFGASYLNLPPATNLGATCPGGKAFDLRLKRDEPKQRIRGWSRGISRA